MYFNERDFFFPLTCLGRWPGFGFREPPGIKDSCAGKIRALTFFHCSYGIGILQGSYYGTVELGGGDLRSACHAHLKHHFFFTLQNECPLTQVNGIRDVFVSYAFVADDLPLCINIIKEENKTNVSFFQGIGNAENENIFCFLSNCAFSRDVGGYPFQPCNILS